VTAAVHDIVVMTPLACSRVAAAAPPWVEASLTRAPFAVVRRERRVGVICVGIRGATRSERFAADLDAREIERRITPEELAERSPARAHPVLSALAQAGAIARAYKIGWGPAGAAAFELATGLPVLSEESDLDLVLRLHPADERVPVLARAFTTLCARVDAELDFDDGCGTALNEAAAPGRLLVKTALGPRLVSAWV